MLKASNLVYKRQQKLLYLYLKKTVKCLLKGNCTHSTQKDINKTYGHASRVWSLPISDYFDNIFFLNFDKNETLLVSALKLLRDVYITLKLLIQRLCQKIQIKFKYGPDPMIFDKVISIEQTNMVFEIVAACGGNRGVSLHLI